MWNREGLRMASIGQVGVVWVEGQDDEALRYAWLLRQPLYR